MNIGSVDEILDFAIGEEIAAYEFYMDLSSQVDRNDTKLLFQEFAAEEEGHKVKLEGIKKGKLLIPSQDKVMDLKISDYVVDVDPSDKIDYQKALILAMKKEKSAFRMYTDLSAKAPNEDLKNTFLALAQEEARHKLRFELEYDEQVMRDN